MSDFRPLILTSTRRTGVRAGLAGEKGTVVPVGGVIAKNFTVDTSETLRTRAGVAGVIPGTDAFVLTRTRITRGCCCNSAQKEP